MKREEFPVLKNNPSLIYLDSAATTLKPRRVILAMERYYKEYGANVHRGIYKMAEKATAEFEKARRKVAEFLKTSPSQIVFTKNATEGINFVAYGFLKPRLKKGNLILTTILEHHSNLLPYLELVKEKKAEIFLAPLGKDNRLDLKPLFRKLKKAAFLAITLASNLTGEILETGELVSLASQLGVPVLIDASQAVSHLPINLKELPVDFLVFSGHKLYGPTGIGVLYVKEERQKEFKPVIFGGEMVLTVDQNLEPIYNHFPYCLEAGTPPIAEAIGLREGVEFIEGVGWEKILKHDRELTEYTLQKLAVEKEIKILGPKEAYSRLPIFSLSVQNLHPHDLASILDEENIAVRAGQICAAPAIFAFGYNSVLRASAGVYTTKAEIDKFIEALKKAIFLLKKR